MKRNLLMLSLLMLAMAATAQSRPNRAMNRYGQPIVNVDGTWQPGSAALLAGINDRLDTISEYNVPYKYAPEKIAPEEWEQSTTQVFTYKTYPTHQLQLAVDMPKVRADDSTPLLIMIHGGGWRNGSYDAPNFVRQGKFFAGKGITVVRVGYTLAGDGNIVNTVEDIQDAIRWIAERADQFNVDTSRIGFTGISAGGHLSSYMAMTWPGTKVLVDHCGPQYLERMFGQRAMMLAEKHNEEAQTLLRYFLALGGDTGGLAKYSPPNNIPEADKIPAVMLMHGDFDLIVPLDHTTQFEAALKEKGAKTVETRIVPCGKHTYLGPDRASFEDDMLSILAFLKKHL